MFLSVCLFVWVCLSVCAELLVLFVFGFCNLVCGSSGLLGCDKISDCGVLFCFVVFVCRLEVVFVIGFVGNE